MSARINVLPADPSVVEALSAEFGLPSFISTVMAARGITTIEQARSFLSPSLDTDWHDPYEIAGMSELADRLSVTVRENKRVLVFGDFDLDGISATTIMTRGLRAIGVDAIPFVPLRFEEGYGLSEAAIKRVLTYEPDVVITVDNGIAAKNEVKLLQAAGVEVLITDHHEPSELVPEGVPVVDPKCDRCASAILAGAGVALKVIQVMGGRFGKPELWRDLVDLATLGTVADLMPTRGENRALIARGVEMLNDNPRPCIAALVGEAGYADKPLTAANLSFSLVPRLNAAGRMGNAQLALDLLMADEFDEACALAAELERTNTRRRSIEAELADVALAQAETIHEGKRVLVVAGEGWHEGVKGIVASRLVNRYGVPSILFTIDGDEARGSGRSVGSVNLFAAIESCSDLLTRFGGHEAAVGVTIPAKNLPEFFDRLNDYMNQLPAEEFLARVDVDAVVDLTEIDLATVAMLDRLAPFGQENPTPKFLAHGVTIAQARAVGAEKNHLSCTLTDGTASLNCIMFHCPDVDGLLGCGSVVNAVFQLQIDEWRGRRSVKAVVSSLDPVEPCRALRACLDESHVSFVDELVERGDCGGEGFPQACCLGASDAELRAQWGEVARGDASLLEQALLESFIGTGSLHASQREVLDHLSLGESVLAILGTGRGKSLIFQLHACRRTLAEGCASLFVYPLRALVSDQAYYLSRALEPFGLNVAVLNGETDEADRTAAFRGLADGSVAIALTTPEFLEAHADEFAASGRIGFVVVDEAHHIGTSKAGFRPSYRRLAELVGKLGHPQILALTATANGAIADAIKEDLGIARVITDEHSRDNLAIDDQRNIRKRERYLVSLVVRGEKTIVYVNSRKESVALTRMLRHQVPHLAPLIGFYNAGLTREERARVEELFRTDGLQVLVATSAFGEGVNIPGVRHVVLYHLPFSEVEFNQMSGRAGRDGNPATVHLLFGKGDDALNGGILAQATPSHDVMGQIYRELRRMQRTCGQPFFSTSCAALAKQASGIVPSFDVAASQVGCGLAVFAELGLVELRNAPGNATDVCEVHVVDYGGKVELTDSVLYREGLDEIDSFNAFRDWILKRSVESLEERIRKPLLP